MSKYTSLETSRKLYEAFPEWEKPKDYTEMHWMTGVDEPTQFVYDNCCGMDYGDDYICPAYDTDYLLEKLPKKFHKAETIHYLTLRAKYGDEFIANYISPSGYLYFYFEPEDDTPAEALALLALKLKEEGIL